MRWTGNTVLVTGGGSGIGRGLAIALHRLDNRVLIAGRRVEALRAVADEHPGIECVALDISSSASIRAVTDRVRRDYPSLNVVVNNAGAMATEDLAARDHAMSESLVATNLTGPMALTSMLLPTLRKHHRGAIVNVTSALAFVPLSSAPTYSATKAALHSYTESLRFQLRHSSIHVVEIVPPRVRTEMPGPCDGNEVLDVETFVDQVLGRWATEPNAREIVVDASRPLRYAERDGAYERQFAAVNSA
jgi:uncharacterized oxidoreductase